MKIAICDDNKVMLEFLVRHISDGFSSCSITCEISGFVSGEDFLESHKKSPFDVAFLDIKMPDIDGFEVAKRVRELSEKTHIIFVTTESSLVYDSFDYHPFYFIPKGNTEILKAKLESVIGKLVEQFNNNRSICFDLPHGEKKYIDSNSICYISSKSNYLDIVCKTETIHIRRKISEMMDELPQKIFARIHNRIIVNMSYVCRIDGTRLKAILYDDTELDISRAYKQEFLEKYNVYLRNFT